MLQPPSSLPLTPAGLMRRLGAIVYDSLLLIAVLAAATALALLVCAIGLGAEAIKAQNPLPGNSLYTAYLLGVCFLFYGWFWTRGGQTLGMRAWKIRVQQRDGAAVNWLQALERFIMAIVSWSAAGLGFWWMLMDREKMTWHDRFSDTVIVRVESQPHRTRRSA